MTERAQLKKILDLEAQQGQAFFEKTFGGAARVEKVHQFLQDLQANGCELYVCSKGLIGSVRYTLEKLKLIGYFQDVFGRITEYDNHPTDFDKAFKNWTPSDPKVRSIYLLLRFVCGG